MTTRRYRPPSTSALTAFESAARHCNFSRAAEELNTSQSAISRHIAGLEARLGARLFEREKRRLTITAEGEQYYRAVVSGLEAIEAAARAIAAAAGGDLLTIACSHEISHLYLMPRFEALQAAVGEEIQIRILTSEYDALEEDLDPRIDLAFTYQAGGAEAEDRAVLFREAVTPVAAPVFAEAHSALLAGPPAGWGALAFLQLTKQNRGWATWDDWCRAVGGPRAMAQHLRFDNYVYLLEAAAAGRGLALGWRGLVERYLEAGTLLALRTDFVEFDRALMARLTARGRQRAPARRCLDFLRARSAIP